MINEQAKELNDAIQASNPTIIKSLSQNGLGFFFPKMGIIKQSGDAKGKNINATIGIALEDDGTPVSLKAIQEKIDLDPQQIFPYASSYGVPDLRTAWKEMIKKKNPSLKNEISKPVVTNALTHGLSVAGMMFVNPGDKIILPDQFWGNYKLIFSQAYGAELETFNTFKNGGFDVDSFKASLDENPGKQIILLNFPNNPTGYTPTNDELAAIVKTIKESAEAGNNIVVLTDDAYFGLVYEDGIYTESVFAELANVHENVLAVKIDGATKEDYVWGLRVGFISFSAKGITQEALDALEAKAGGVVRGTISNDSHLSQSLLLNAFTDPGYNKEKAEKYELLKKRYTETIRVLNDNPHYANYFEALPFNSGYFMCVQLKGDFKGEDIRQILLADYSTGVIALGTILRIAFSAVPTDKLGETFENIYQACKKA